MDLTKEACNKAVEVLEKCVTPHGLHAAYPGYPGVWSRDSTITALGASLVGEKFKPAIKQSLILLGREQSKKGQIPNAIMFDVKPPQVDYKSIDSTLWFVVGHYMFKHRYGDSSLLRKYRKNIEKALTWLSYQDMGEDGMLEQLPTTDWQDACPHKYGHTINTQALYFKVLNFVGEKKEARELKEMVNNDKEDGLWEGNYYLPWRWKNHNKYKEKEEWFDSLGNFLAIVFGLADKKRAEKIVSYVKRMRINKPYPVRAIHPPIKKGDREWQDYFLDSLAGEPWHYLNSGVWTYIGGFYVLSLIKLRKFREAELQLRELSEANMKKPYFSEWLDGRSGKPCVSGGNSDAGGQAWNAGMYILAYESLRKKKVLIP